MKEESKIAFLGDIMPGGVLHYQDEYVDDEVKKYLFGFDLRVATLETALGDCFSFDEEKMRGRMNIIYAKDRDIQKVVDLRIDVVSIANNHVFDLGVEGFRNTLKLLNDNHILYCGGGMNIEEASRPVVVKIHDKTVAILAYCQYGTKHIGHVPIATKDEPGVNPLDESKFIPEIQEAKKMYDYVFVMPHWGKEYTVFPTVECKRLAYLMIEAGADGVIGSHTHQVQPRVTYKKCPIFYSLGNFMFADFYVYPPRPMWYPKELSEVENIKTEEDYVFPVTEPLKMKWRETSRVGMIVGLGLNNGRVRDSYRLSRLTDDNVVSFVDATRKVERPLFIVGLLLKYSFYQEGKYYCKLRKLLNIKYSIGYVKRKIWGK